MNGDLKTFGDTARGLVKNPLGIIALFIVLVYGFAALVTVFARSLSESERLPLIWFVLFPVLVLAVFSWLVSRHGGKLYGPSDYKNEENYVRMQLRQLETRVRVDLASPPHVVAPHRPSESVATPHSDARLGIAQMRLDVEKELFLLARLTPELSGDVTSWHVGRYIEELERVKVLEPDLAENLREFVAIANKIVHDTSFVEEDARSAAAVGSSLVANLHHKRLVAALEREFDGHLIWHLHRGAAGESTKHHFWAALAMTLPEFEYDFEVYQDAAKRYLDKARKRDDARTTGFYVLSLEEFVQVLEFRERELQRIIKLWTSSGWRNDEAPEWEWPPDWASPVERPCPTRTSSSLGRRRGSHAGKSCPRLLQTPGIGSASLCPLMASSKSRITTACSGRRSAPPLMLNSWTALSVT